MSTARGTTARTRTAARARTAVRARTMVSTAVLARAVAVLLAVVSTVAGCGIGPTGVTDGGEPAVGFQPSTRLYFVSGERLRAVSRPLPWPPLKETLEMLLEGPVPAERRRGLRTELDPGTDALGRVTSDAAKVHISLTVPEPVPSPAPPQESAPARQLSRYLWLGQLTCTAASALAARSNIDPDAVTVVIQRGRAGRLGSFRCSEFPRAPE
ncbi:hypothetical protein [Streptosporangium sp. NPDC048865]|uniref:hypothetical protein n=1 Tax=Streptosporangium sp. NPDC048865 TaxID=3155766 RepID=UPI00343FC112